MRKRLRTIGGCIALSSAGVSCHVAAEPVADQQIDVSLPVYEGDIERPYVIVGQIKANLRKHFSFQATPTKVEIFAESWGRAEKLGADAVINARFGPTKATLFDYGRTPISGTAVKFVDGKLKP